MTEPRLRPFDNGYLTITEPPEPRQCPFCDEELGDGFHRCPNAPHDARARRIFRHGAWQDVAWCGCGWERNTTSSWAAEKAAAKHNRETS